jgi:hypothetical protein
LKGEDIHLTQIIFEKTLLTGRASRVAFFSRINKFEDAKLSSLSVFRRLVGIFRNFFATFGDGKVSARTQSDKLNVPSRVGQKVFWSLELFPEGANVMNANLGSEL